MTTQTLYQKTLNEQMTPAEFLWHVRRDPQYNSIVTNTMSYEDTVNCLKSKGYIWDSKKEENSIKPFDLIGTIRSLNEGTIKKQKLKGGKGDKLTPDQVNYYEFKKGWKHELEHTDDIDKAKEIALDHLAEDPMYYTRLEMIEVKAKKKERSDLPIDISKKKADVKDAKNQMSPVEKKKVSSNVSDSGKQEKARSKNAGVKKMKGGSGEMKSIKEASSDLEKGEMEDELEKIKIKPRGTEQEKGKFQITSIADGSVKSINIPYEMYKTLVSKGQYTNITAIDDDAKKIVQQYEQDKKSGALDRDPEKERNIEKERRISSVASKLSKDGTYEIKSKTGDKISTVSLSDEEAEKRISNPEKYGLEYIKKSSSSMPMFSKEGDALPYFVHDSKTKELLKFDTEASAKELKAKDSSRYRVIPAQEIKKENVFKIETERGRESVRMDMQGINVNPKKYVAYFTTPEANARVSDPEKYGLVDIKRVTDSFFKRAPKEDRPEKTSTETAPYLVVNIKTGAIASTHQTGKEAKESAKSKNDSIGSENYKAVSNLEAKAKKYIQESSTAYEILEAYIRQKVRKYIAENIEGRYVGYAGPMVVKKKLEDYLKRYNPDWESDPSQEQRAVGSEYEDVIAKLVQELNGDVPGLGTKIYKKYSDKPLDGAKANQVQLPANISYDPTKLVSRGGRIAEDEIISKQEKEKKKDKDEAGMGIGDRTIVYKSTVEKDKTVPGPKKELLSKIQDFKDKMQKENPEVSKNELQQKLQTEFGTEIDSLYSKGAASPVVNYIINP